MRGAIPRALGPARFGLLGGPDAADSLPFDGETMPATRLLVDAPIVTCDGIWSAVDAVMVVAALFARWSVWGWVDVRLEARERVWTGSWSIMLYTYTHTQTHTVSHRVH